MSQHLNHGLALCAALFVTMSSIGAIITVPPAYAATTATPIGMVELA